MGSPLMRQKEVNLLSFLDEAMENFRTCQKVMGLLPYDSGRGISVWGFDDPERERKYRLHFKLTFATNNKVSQTVDPHSVIIF